MLSGSLEVLQSVVTVRLALIRSRDAILVSSKPFSSCGTFKLVTVFGAVTFRREVVQLPTIPPIMLATSIQLQQASGGFITVLSRRL